MHFPEWSLAIEVERYQEFFSTPARALRSHLSSALTKLEKVGQAEIIFAKHP
jgi:hypothetical protein